MNNLAINELNTDLANAHGNIDKIESNLLKADQVECSLIHHFGPGIYIREVSIPAGTFSVGHHQKLPHYNVMLKGRVLMINPDNTTTELVAPVMFTAPPGRKIGWIIEDMVWQNIYATDETDIDALEDMYIEKSDQWNDIESASKRAEYIMRESDRLDYEKVLSETGTTEEVARSQSENKADQIDMPFGAKPYRILPSGIEGDGYFLTVPADKDELIAIARISGKRTHAGRYVNHSMAPNARMIRSDNGDIRLVANRRIKGCVGGSGGEEVTICYRDALSLSREVSSLEDNPCQQ